MREKTCCFSGHRHIAAADVPAVRAGIARAIGDLIERGVTDFIAGGAYGFDTMAAQEVLRLRETHPIRLILALPCENQTARWADAYVAEYERIRELADEVHVLAKAYDSGCMLRRNDWMISHSAYLICYRKKTMGGTAYTVKQAVAQGLQIRNLAKPENL